MNFYASQDYLDAVAAAYFRGQKTKIEDVRIGRDVLRLLVVDGKYIITKHQFLDYHEPLRQFEVYKVTQEGRYAQSVAHGVVQIIDWQPNVYLGFDIAPYVDWSQFQQYEDYKLHLLMQHRGLVRDRERRRRRLKATHGELRFTMNDEQDDVLPFAERWKRAQLCERGIPNYFLSNETMEFLKALRSKGVLTSSTLRVSGRLASVWIGFVYRGSWSGWIFTYDPYFRRYSVGHQLLDFMLEESHRLGHREFDFSVGGEDYKMIYATHGRLLGTVGRLPLRKRLIAFTKCELKQRTPVLFQAVRATHRYIKHKTCPTLSISAGE